MLLLLSCMLCSLCLLTLPQTASVAFSGPFLDVFCAQTRRFLNTVLHIPDHCSPIVCPMFLDRLHTRVSYVFRPLFLVVFIVVMLILISRRFYAWLNADFAPNLFRVVPAESYVPMSFPLCSLILNRVRCVFGPLFRTVSFT
jgi:hypothetical protein